MTAPTNPTQEVTMPTNHTPEVDDFTAMREAWKAKGRPADPADPYWASVLAAQDAPRVPATPLVIFG